MSQHERLDAELRSLLERFNASRPLTRLQRGEIGVQHYASHLRQNYFQLRERPVILAATAARLRGCAESSKRLHKRALEEIHHDQLVLSDLRALGADLVGIEQERPLPETTALLAFAHYQVEHLMPVGILGTMYFLDFAPLYASDEIAEALAKIGVPSDAMSSLHDHRVVGPRHTREMQAFVEELVAGDAELDAVVNAMRTTATLFTHMIEAAFDAAD